MAENGRILNAGRPGAYGETDINFVKTASNQGYWLF
jgi:hypothetical protein